MTTRSDKNELPDLIELRKQLSEANKLRHKFWIKLREVRNQIYRYIKAHNTTEKDFINSITKITDERKEDLKDERKVGKTIPLQELEQLFHIANLLWNSLNKEEATRDYVKRRSPLIVKPDNFYYGNACINCHLPLSGKMRRFCSTNCADQYRKKEFKRKSKDNQNRKSNQTAENIKPTVSTGGEPNPQKGAGKRNIRCQHYSNCLNTAINWSSFNCYGCSLKNSQTVYQ